MELNLDKTGEWKGGVWYPKLNREQDLKTKSIQPEKSSPETKSSEKIDGIRKKIKDLAKKVRNLQDGYHLKLYKLLIKYLEENKKINEKYKIVNMASELDMNPDYIYQILSYQNATKETKKILKEGKLSFMRIARVIFNSRFVKDQDEIFAHVIKNNLSFRETDRYLVETYGYNKNKKVANSVIEKNIIDNINKKLDDVEFCINNMMRFEDKKHDAKEISKRLKRLSLDIDKWRLEN